MAERDPPVLMQYGLCGGNDESAVFNGAGTQQNFPVGFPCLAGEGGRNRQNLGVNSASARKSCGKRTS